MADDNPQIVKDLEKHFEARLRKLALDHIDMVSRVTNRDEGIASVGAILMTSLGMLLAGTTTMTGREVAEEMAKSVERHREHFRKRGLIP